MQIGQKGPNFRGLLDVSGRKYGLSDFSAKKIVVVIFSCNP